MNITRKLTQNKAPTLFSIKNASPIATIPKYWNGVHVIFKRNATLCMQTRDFHVNPYLMSENSTEKTNEKTDENSNENPLPEEVQNYLKKNSPITIEEGKNIQNQLVELAKSTDFSHVQTMPHDNDATLHEKWFKAMESISALRNQVLKQFPQFNGDEERLKVWLGRLSNHSEAIRERQAEFTQVIAEKLFGIKDFEPQITDTRAIGIFYQADRIVQEEMLNKEEFASKSLKDFAKGKIFDANVQRTMIFPRLYQEERRLLKIEQDEQNEYRKDIREQVEEARKEMEEAGKTLELIEGADKIQKELSDMDTPTGWIQYKLQLGQAYYRFG